jgi:hypothetical protein
MMAYNLNYDSCYDFDLKKFGFENKEKLRLKKRDYKNRFTKADKHYTNSKQYRTISRTELNHFKNIGNLDNFMMPSKISFHKRSVQCRCCWGIDKNKIYSNNFSYV